MKITKIMKTHYLLLLAFFTIGLFSGQIFAQEKEKEVRVKMVKEKDGERTVVDTSFTIHGDEDFQSLEELKALMKEEGFEDFDIEFEGDEDITVDVMKMDASNNQKIMVVKQKKGEDAVEEEEYTITIMKADPGDGTSTMKMTMNADGHGVLITDDGEVHEIEKGEGEHKIIMYKQGDGDEMDLMFSGDEAVWVDDEKHYIEIIEGEDGKKVIVENEDGTKREYNIEEGKGTYFIDEEGELEKVDEDATWVSDQEGMEKITVHVGGDHEAIVITEDGETIELKDFGKNQNVFFYSTDEGEGEQQVFIEVIEKKEGDKTIKMKQKIIVQSVCEDDIKSLEKSGVKLGSEDTEKLEIEKLVFHPNPSDGKFNLEFSTPESGTTEVLIYDVNGNKVYEERITNFKGKYNKEIDISSENKGTYFLVIRQDNKVSSRKIILE